MKKNIFRTIGIVVIIIIIFTINNFFKNATRNVSHEAWIVLQNYLVAAKEHNIEEVKKLSHQLSSSCADTANEDNKKNCFALMDNVYNIGITLKESDFVHAWSDSKQIILFTDPTRGEDKNNLGEATMVLYFTIDKKGKPKILGMNPYRYIYVNKEGLSAEDAEKKLETLLKDSDEDGLLDNDEECKVSLAEANCQKTDPLKRDTDGNGYWDGIEALFYKPQ